MANKTVNNKHSICELTECPALRLLSPGLIKTRLNCILLLVVTVTVTFLHAQVYLPLQNQPYPCLQSKNRNANACE